MDEYLKMGNQWFDKGDFQKAIENYLKELESGPSNIEVLLKLIQSYYEIGDFHTALNAIEVITDQDPQNRQALVFKGYCYQELRMFDHAEKVFSFLIDMAPYDPENYLNRGKARKYLGNKEGYKDDFKKCEFLKSFCLDPIFSMAAVNRLQELDMEEFKNAEREFIDIIVKDVNNYQAYFDLGVAFDKILAYKSASNAYTKAISLYKEGLYDIALFKRANAYFNNKEYKEALYDIEVYLEYFPQNQVLSELKNIIIKKDLK